MWIKACEGRVSPALLVKSLHMYSYYRGLMELHYGVLQNLRGFV